VVKKIVKPTGKNIIAETLLYYNKSAVLELSRGNYADALELFRKSQLIEQEMGLHQQKAQTMMNSANTELLLGELDKALSFAEEAAEIFAKQKCRRDHLQALLLTGFIYAQRKDHKNALRRLEEVIRKSDTDDQKGEAYLALYHLYLTEEKRGQAQEAITKAVQFFDKGGKIDRLKLALEKRAAFFQELKKNDLAAIDLNRSKSLSQDEEDMRKTFSLT